MQWYVYLIAIAAIVFLGHAVVELVSRPYDIDGRHIVIGASIGIAIAPNDGSNPDLLLKKSGVFSKALQNTPAFVDAVRDALVSLYTEGACTTLARTLTAVQSKEVVK